MWPLISRITSPARWVLSSTNPPTNRTGIVMVSARKATTISFRPMDRDLTLLRKVDCAADGENSGKSIMYQVLYNTKHEACQEGRWSFGAGLLSRQSSRAKSRDLLFSIVLTMSW